MKLTIEIDKPEARDLVGLHCSPAADKNGVEVSPRKWIANATFVLRRGDDVVAPLGVNRHARLLVLDDDGAMPTAERIAEAFHKRLVEEGWLEE